MKHSPKELERLSDDELLDLRICDLDVRIENTVLEERVNLLFEELESRGVRFRPHFWLSEEWFSPDGIPGVAIPFYLAHPRLVRLERKMMLEAEGSAHNECMKILRHEVGHAIDTAYRLRRLSTYRTTFGKVSQAYPRFYQPRPYSKSFVIHLDMWYAQSHPVEDFAETFAVWLRPRSRWRAQYADWPAIKKIEFVNDLMQEIADQKPLVVAREHFEPHRTNRKTLRQFYQRKRDYYGMEYPNFYDRDLRRLFSDAPEYKKNLFAATFLSRSRAELRRAISKWTAEYQYTIDQVLGEMIQRCRELKLRLFQSESETKRNAMIMLTVQTMNYLHEGHHRVAL